MKKIILALFLCSVAGSAFAGQSQEIRWRTIVVDAKTFCTIGTKGPIIIHKECFKNPNYVPTKDDVKEKRSEIR